MKGEKLSYEIIESQPRDFDFSQGFGETWDLPFELTDEEIENEAYAPLMNYIYPLPDGFSVPDNFRERLNCTTIVRVGDQCHLALTGGGMDLSWEICESYLNLGLYPPVHFCRLPAMSGRGNSPGDKRIVDGCNQSLRALIGWYSRRLENNRRRYSK
jgi:hypothetical protein